MDYIAAKYLYIETSAPRQQGDIARLESSFSYSGPSCFTFWYHMLGSSIGKLDIYTQSSIGGKQLKWTLSGNQGSNWHRAEVNFDSINDRYKVSISTIS